MKKKSIKSGCFIIVLIISALLLWQNFSSIKTRKENRFRRSMAVVLKKEVESYFGRHQYYPENVSMLNFKQQNIVQDYIRGGVLTYDRATSGREWFSITCRYSGMLTRDKSPYKLSWSGIQFSNRIDRLPLPTGEKKPKADQNGFYTADFH